MLRGGLSTAVRSVGGNRAISTTSNASFWRSTSEEETSAGKSHSTQLSDGRFIYEFIEHKVKPGHVTQFTKQYEAYLSALSEQRPSSELVGGFRTAFGDVDSTVHILRHSQGFADVDRHIEGIVKHDRLAKMEEEIGQLCRRRESSLLKSFSYWGDPQPRPPRHIYDLRRYVLKPGQMIEWANNWVKGIAYRREANQDVGGWFTQVGSLYVVYHLWAYESMEQRKQVRELTWSKEGWDQTVAYTVPLIQKMKSQIMIPTSYSPLQ